MKRSIFLLLLLLFGAVFVACAPEVETTEAPATTTVTPVSTTVVTTTEVVDAPLSPLAAGYILRADGIEIDGVLDAAYLESASLCSIYQDPGYTEDPTLIVDPTKGIAMKRIYRGAQVAEDPATAFMLYFLWGEEEGVPYIYVAAVIHDETITTRCDEYMAYPNPWLNDAIELSYHFGGDAAPVIPLGQDTYPTYHNVLVDAREKSVDDHSAATPNHTAVAAQRSYYFDGIESATALLDEVTYVVELKIPAYTEEHTGTPGPEFERSGGRTLEAGDLLYFCVELCDLTYLPEGYDDALPSEPKYTDEWSYSALGAWKSFENSLMPYMYCGGNRNAAYLRTEGAGPAALQLSARTVTP